MEEVSASECVPDLKELEVKLGRKTPDGLLRWMRQDAAQRGEHSKVIRQERADSGENSKVIRQERADSGEHSKVIRQERADSGENSKVIRQERADSGENSKVIRQERADSGENSKVIRQERADSGENSKVIRQERADSGENSKVIRQERADSGENSKVIRQERADSGEHGLDEKIRKLKVEMAHLRAVDVKILQQLVALHEGIEAAKWLMEDRGMLTSHCSSLTGSQYSLGGSWSSLHEPHDKLDNISIGSYLDTLADDLDEYCTSSGAESVLCTASLCTDNTKSAQVKPNGPKEDVRSSNHDSNHVEASKCNGANTGVLNSTVKQDTDSPKALAAEKLAKTLSPKSKIYKNGKVELESCKMNGKVHLEYDAHWHWVQSQDDVTFL